MTSHHAQLLSPVVIFVHQVVACSESHQSGVVGRRRDGDGAGAADVGVAQLVGEELQLVRSETVVVPEDVVVGGTAGSLRTDGTPSARGHTEKKRQNSSIHCFHTLFTLQSILRSYETTVALTVTVRIPHFAVI